MQYSFLALTIINDISAVKFVHIQLSNDTITACLNFTYNQIHEHLMQFFIQQKIVYHAAIIIIYYVLKVHFYSSYMWFSRSQVLIMPPRT